MYGMRRTRVGRNGGVSYKVRIKSGDTVSVLAGQEKGKRGKVLQIIPQEKKVFIEKLRMMKRHVKPSKDTKGGIIEKEGPVHISNVLLVCPHCDKPTRIGIRVLEDGHRLRQCKKCGEVIDKG